MTERQPEFRMASSPCNFVTPNAPEGAAGKSSRIGMGISPLKIRSVEK